MPRDDDRLSSNGSEILHTTDLPAHALSRSGSFVIARPPGMRPSGTMFLAIGLTLWSPLLFGYSLGFTSPAKSTMEGVVDSSGSDPSAPPAHLIVFDNGTESSMFAAIINIGCLIGALLGAVISDLRGRTKALGLSAIPMVVTFPLLYVVDNWILLTILRFVMGIGVGIGSAVAPCYIGEVATLELRGALGAMNQLSITVGIFAANLFGTFVFTAGDSGQFCEWRNMALLGLLLACFIMTTFFIPESPRFHAKQGNLRETRASLMKIRKVTENFDQELMEIINQTPALARAVSMETVQSGNTPTTEAPPRSLETVQTQEEIDAASLGRYKKSFIVGIGLLVFQQLSGCNAIIFYVSPICKSAGLGSSANLAGTLAMAAQVVFTLIACILMEKAPRRFFLKLSCTLCALAHFLLAYYFFADAAGATPPTFIALGSITLYIIGFSFGLGPIPWLMLAELFPTEVRGMASSIAIAVNWLCSFLVTLVFGALTQSLGNGGTFLLFGCIVVVGLFFTICIVPETRGKNIEEVLQELNGTPQQFPQDAEWPVAAQGNTQIESSARDVLLNA